MLAVIWRSLLHIAHADEHARAGARARPPDYVTSDGVDSGTRPA
jgi:hypothetical protein